MRKGELVKEHGKITIYMAKEKENMTKENMKDNLKWDLDMEQEKW